MSLRSKLNKVERRTAEVAADCPTCLAWIAIVSSADKARPEFRTCPACGRVRGGVVVIVDDFEPAWAG